jgi:hypothetical protein
MESMTVGGKPVAPGTAPKPGRGPGQQYGGPDDLPPPPPELMDQAYQQHRGAPGQCSTSWNALLFYACVGDGMCLVFLYGSILFCISHFYSFILWMVCSLFVLIFSDRIG